MKIPIFKILVVILAGSTALLASAAKEDRYAAARAEFIGAYIAVQAGIAPPAADSAELAAYPLYPYLRAARLQHALQATPVPAALDARIAEFLKQDGTAVASRELRHTWLLSLADRQRWALFLTSAPEDPGDATLRCAALAAHIALGQSANLAPAVIGQWLSAIQSPSTCDAPFAWLRAQPAWNSSLIEQRARLALDAGNSAFARSLAAMLPAERAAPLLQWAALIENPQAEINALIDAPERSVEHHALLDGWTRFARSDPEAAEKRWAALLAARHLDAAAASPFARVLGQGLSWSRLPAALHYFNRVAPADVDPLTAAWWARAALWAGDWPQVTRAIAALPESERSEQRWRYWALRAAAAQDQAGVAAQMAQLAGENGWYPALAAARLHQPYAPHPEPVVVDRAVEARLAALPGVERAHELFLVSMRAAASAEWVHALDGLDAAGQIQGIDLAARWGWYEQAVATATGQHIFADYQRLYPRPFDDAVQHAAARSGVSEDLIYGVLRQESLYRADAVSRANAYGLMQMISSTAARTARQLDRPAPSAAALLDPDLNILLGATHLRELIDRFDGQVPIAIAGYNAGPNAAARWLPPAPLDLDIWIENIPYNETRNYVQRVLWHTLVFGWQRSGKAQKLDLWRQPIAGTMTADGAS